MHALLLLVLSSLDDYPRQQGVDVLGYQVTLDVDLEHETLECAETIEVSVDRALREIKLDYQGPELAQVAIDRQGASVALRAGQLVLAVSEAQAADGRLVIATSYRGRPQRGFYFTETTHHRKVAYTDCWPELARGWLPCIDHPSDRALVEFRIRVKPDLVAIANGAEVATMSLPDQRIEHRFRQTVPIATYLFAVAIGPLEATRYHSPSIDERKLALTTFTYPEEHDAAVKGFEPTARVLDALESLVGPFPFAKLALVQIPTRFGGMENASCIFLNEHCLERGEPLLPLIAHEMAHQWFGDLIGLADWGELWLSEGFATYGTVLVQEKLEGRSALVREMRRLAQGLLASDEARHRSIRNRHVNDPEVELNSLNYDKGAFVLHMLRRTIGDEAFFKTLREHVATNSGKVVATEDFRQVAENVSGRELDRFFAQWIDRPGYPELRVAHRVESRNGKLVLVVDVDQTQSEDPFDLELDLTIDSTARRVIALSNGQRRGTFEFQIDKQPDIVTFNDERWLLAKIVE